MRIAAVVPTWNAREAVLGCLAALGRSTLRAHALVVDNGSRDGTAAAVREHFVTSEVLVLPRNAGFARAVNLGIARALERGFDAVLLLNDDAHVAPSALEHLAGALARDPSLGLAAPRLDDARGRIWYAGGSISRRTAIVRHDRRGERDDGRAEDVRRVTFAPLTAALVHRRALERTGLLDERFFVYYEDVDLALRLDRAGLGLAYVPAARAVHDVGLTARRDPVARHAHEARSLCHLLAKHYRGGALATAIPALLVDRALRYALLALWRGEPALVVGPLRGLGWFLEERRRQRTGTTSPVRSSRSASVPRPPPGSAS